MMTDVLRTQPRFATQQACPDGLGSPAVESVRAAGARLLRACARCGLDDGASRTLLQHGSTTPAALTGGFHWALWVCGLTAVAAIPVGLSRRTKQPVRP